MKRTRTPATDIVAPPNPKYLPPGGFPSFKGVKYPDAYLGKNKNSYQLSIIRTQSFFSAVHTCEPARIKELIDENGSEIDLNYLCYGSTIFDSIFSRIQQRCWPGGDEIFDLIMDSCVRPNDINMRNKHYHGSALHSIFRSSYVPLRCLRRLLDAGADANLLAQGGVRPLHFACSSPNRIFDKPLALEFVKCLIDRGGADVNMVDELWRSPLFYALQNGFFEVIPILLERGADPTIRAKGSNLLFKGKGTMSVIDYAKMVVEQYENSDANGEFVKSLLNAVDLLENAAKNFVTSSSVVKNDDDDETEVRQQEQEVAILEHTNKAKALKAQKTLHDKNKTGKKETKKNASAGKSK